MHSPRLHFCPALVLGLCGPAALLLGAPDPAPPSAPVESSTLQCGALPNGFRYAFLPRTREPGRVSLRLVVQAGSLDERDDESGYAHFVEHMAFNGTRHFPAGKLVLLFERLGLAWGANVNAATSFTSTIYRLDLPAGHAGHLGENELRRAREQGFGADEVKESAAALVARLRAEVAEFDGRTTDQVANDVAVMLAAGRTWQDPAAWPVLAESLLPEFTPELAAATLRETLPDERLHLVLFRASPPEGGAGAVLAAYRASAARPLPAAAPKAGDELQFRYGDFGPPGAVAEHRTEADLGLELLRFANGVRLNLRASTTEPQRFKIKARPGRGPADIPRLQPGINLLAFALMVKSDLGRHTREELRRLTALHAVEGSWSFDNNEFIIQLSGPSSALPFALQTLAASVSDVKLDAAKYPDALRLYPAITAPWLNSAAGGVKVETFFRMSGDDPRFRMPPPPTSAPQSPTASESFHGPLRRPGRRDAGSSQAGLQPFRRTLPDGFRLVRFQPLSHADGIYMSRFRDSLRQPTDTTADGQQTDHADNNESLRDNGSPRIRSRLHQDHHWNHQIPEANHDAQDRHPARVCRPPYPHGPANQVG